MSLDYLQTLRVSSAHSLSYAPQYIAQALGMFASEGLDVTFVNYPPSFAKLGSTLANETDLLLGSPVYGDRLRRLGIDVEIVAQSNQQAPLVICGSKGVSTEFQWTDLRGSVVIISRGSTPTSWVAWSESLRMTGLSLTDIRSVIGYSPADGVSEFRNGIGDYLVTDAETAIGNGFAELAAIPDILGPVAFSVYLAMPCSEGPLEEAHARFRRAISSAQQWLYSHDERDASSVLGKYFPDVDRQDISAFLKRYLELNLWVDDGELKPDQLDYWSELLKHAGVVDESFGYARCTSVIKLTR